MRGLRPALGQGRSREDQPRLGVVVPVYNMEPFLAECLDSLLAQSWTDFEAVVVIDGATDGSADIAERYAEQDGRIRVLHQENAGLGAARNTGATAARGEYLAFLDSDDRLPPDAYAAMMDTIQRSGSDMVVGTLKRDTGERQRAMPLMRENHRVRRERVTLADVPLMLADVFAVNKVFRRGFWDENGLAFPERIRYEDQPTLTQAFLAAEGFDVIPEPVYFWRVRDDRSSITQQRHELDDLLDRVETKRISTTLVQESGLPGLLDTWFRDILPVDMWEYFRAVPGCSDEYWSVLRSAVRELWNDQTVPFDRTRVPAQQRLMGWLVGQDRRAELERLIAFVDERRGDVPVEVRGDHVVAVLPGVDDPDAVLPDSVYVLGDHERRWRCRLTGATWEGGLLHLEGFALIQNVPTRDAETRLGAELVPVDVKHDAWPLEVRAEREPRATRFAGRPRQDFDDCGFRTTIDVPALLAASPGVGCWRLSLHREVEQLRAAGGVTDVDGSPVDRSWQDLTAVAGRPLRARVHEQDHELVLECET